jgi:hypothetical protein
MTATQPEGLDMTDEQIRKIATQVYGTLATEQEMRFAFALLSASKPAATQALPQSVLDALRFYAHGHHYNIDDDHQQFDTVSGEPQNWLFSERDDDCTMIEDGSIAKAVLLGGLPGVEEPTEPIEGEVFTASPTFDLSQEFVTMASEDADAPSVIGNTSPAAPSVEQDERGAWQSTQKTPPVEFMEWYGDQFSAPVLLHDGEKVLDVVARWSFVEDGWVGSHFSDGPSPSDYVFLNTKSMRWILLSDACCCAASTSANVAQGAEAQAEAPMADAYVGAREDLSIWKKRALEAEELNRKFMASVNGPTHIGEPVVAAPIYAYEWDCGPGVVHRDFQHCSYNGRYPDRTLTLYAAPPAQTAKSAVALDDEQRNCLDVVIKDLATAHSLDRTADGSWIFENHNLFKFAYAARAAFPQPVAQPVEQIEFPYQRTFNSIAAATSMSSSNAISISVRAFQEAYNAGAQPVEQTPPTIGTQAPFSNCRFKCCDLPGQCRDEGKCHHPAVPAAQPVEQTAQSDFKNFHRLLCERFGYVHDEQDWQRDQLSLIEWIASRAASPQPSRPVEVGEAKRFPTPISISTDKIFEIASKYNLGNPRLDALRGFVNEVILVNEAEYAKSE